MRLLQDPAHVFHVEVANVRAEHWVQGRAVRVHLAIESGGGRAVVALAAEEKVGHEKIADVLGACDLHSRQSSNSSMRSPNTTSLTTLSRYGFRRWCPNSSMSRPSRTVSMRAGLRRCIAS